MQWLAKACVLAAVDAVVILHTLVRESCLRECIPEMCCLGQVLHTGALWTNEAMHVMKDLIMQGLHASQQRQYGRSSVLRHV